MHAKGNKFLKTGVYKIKTKCDLKKKTKKLIYEVLWRDISEQKGT